MHCSRGAGACSGPEVTDLDRAVSLDDGEGDGAGNQRRGDNSNLHNELIERCLIYYEI